MYEELVHSKFTLKRSHSQVNSFPRNTWFDEECKVLKSSVNNVGKQMSRFNNCDPRLKEQAKDLQGKYKRLIQKKKRHYQAREKKKLDDLMNLPNKQKGWDYLKKKSGRMKECANISSEQWFKYFENLSKPPENATFDDVWHSKIEKDLEYLRNNLSENSTTLDCKFTIQEVKAGLKALKNNKAPGVDGIPNEFLKVSDDSFIAILTSLFNFMLEKGEIPEKWSECIICPIFKSGDKTDCNNYRGISLLPSICNLFSSLLITRLENYAITNGLYDPLQAGFRKGYRTSDHMFILHSLCQIFRKAKKNLYCCFVDFRKAFDHVDRLSLWYKLIRVGISGKLFNLIKCLYEKNKSCVKVKGGLFIFFPSMIGVRQGCKLSPFLFALFLSDIKEDIKEEDAIFLVDTFIPYLLYADDMIIAAESTKNLQSKLDQLQLYCKKWRLSVNTKKTKIWVLGTDENFNFIYDGTSLEHVSEYKYLGCIFSNKKKMFHDHIDHLHTQAMKAIFQIKRLNKNFGKLSVKMALMLYDSLVLPILEYGSEIWADSKEVTDKLELLHLRYLKQLLGVKNLHQIWVFMENWVEHLC